jgi:hypothetical protein
VLDQKTKQEIREAFLSGNLRTESVNPTTGEVLKTQITNVLKHHTGHKSSVLVTLDDGREVRTTGDHSLFKHLPGDTSLTPVLASQIAPGDLLVEVKLGQLGSVAVEAVLACDGLQESYDLSVPGPENFVLDNGLLAHNSYSIGGISLDLEKSSKYMDLKRNAEEQWDKLTQAKQQTTHYIRGLSQPRFGRGVRSAFGPNVGRGVLSPRSFL